ncbi:hypothetical protein BJY52DRAFT_691034 [Lactarius psammicola]|nr:hypothetical protein BJY52DRAFT_691034 [Lactarius psammicola]
MMLTRSTTRALLTSRARGDKLPDDILLEIFDAYRQDVRLQPGYETVWDSKSGWFKLAHVCRSWRRVVLLSSSYLDVHLLLTLRRSSRATTLRRLPSLPILIDYSAASASWIEMEESLAPVAIRHCSRVRGITLRPKRPYANMAKVLRTLSHPFPELESLEICPLDPFPFHHDDRGHGLILPRSFLSGSAPCLRRLTLREVLPRPLSPLLSSATGLVELALTLRAAFSALPEASLIANLQRLSCLRRLELNIKYRATRSSDPPLPPASAGDVVPLSKLTHLIFIGHVFYLQALVLELAAPSLQRLDARLCGFSFPFFPIPHLCKFIRDTKCQFTAVRLGLWYRELGFYAGTGSQSVDDQPFKITIPGLVSFEYVGQEFSGPLSTVEELIVLWDIEPWCTEGSIQTDQWRRFCYYVPQVKVVQIPAKVAPDVARSFQEDGRERVLDLLPALERVEVFSVVGKDDLYESVCDAFKPLIASWQRKRRPIRLSWTFWRQDVGRREWLVAYKE